MVFSKNLTAERGLPPRMGWRMVVKPVAACCLALLAGTLRAATSGLFTYTDNGPDITITDYPDGASGAVSIPSTISGKPVTGIGSYAFYGCTGLTGVTIPASVTSIGDFAFSSCPGLATITVNSTSASYASAGGVLFNKTKTTVLQFPGGKSGSYWIPATVTSIADNAFYGCHGLSGITFPSSLTGIGSQSFYDCSGLTAVSVPAGVTGIGEFAFGSCSRLTTIAVDSANKSYSSANGVLFNKNKTTILQYPGGGTGNYKIPDSVTTVAANAFFACHSLNGVTIPSGVTYIGSQAFYDCAALTAITVPTGVTTIGSYAFGSCAGLTSVTLPESLTLIDTSAFYSCVSLGAITIPAGVTNIGNGVFNYCSRLKSIMVDAANPNYASGGGVLYDKLKTKLIAYPEGRSGNYVIPSSVTTIGNLAFANCTGITDMTIPSKVSSIGDYGFYGCTKLDKATFLGNAPSMGTNAFEFTAGGFHIRFVTGKSGFATPTWMGYPCAGVAASPEIDVQQPVGTSLVDGTSKKNLGRMVVGMTSTARTFTIRNTGTSNLTGLSVGINGPNATNFNATTPAESLKPGASTTFKVSFRPSATGTRTATLRIASNDANENPFDINLTGVGVAP